MKDYIFKIFISIVFAFIFLSAPIVVTAQERVVDNASVLNAGERQILLKKIAELSSRYKFDLVIVTVRDTGGVSPKDYAETFFLNNGYGLGPNKDGCIFLQVTSTRDWWTGARGSGKDIFNDYAKNKLKNDVLRYLRANKSYEAFYYYLSNWETFLALYEKGGRTYNFVYQFHFIILVIVWAVAFGIGFLVVHSWKKKMSTVLGQTQAAAYIVSGSLIFDQKTDQFLYSTVTKTSRESSSGGGRSGGGTGSSGRGFSGVGGKY